MNRHFLMDGVIRQTTVLLAQLATAGGVRAPLSHIANQVFLDLTGALEEQGVSRKVGADMFGMALRAYKRKIQRLRESTTFRGRSLWEAVFAFVAERPMVTRNEVMQRFTHDEEALVRGVLHDLVDSGLVFSNGSGGETVYRSASEDELRYVRRLRPEAGADELLWVAIYREGPLTREAVLARGGVHEGELDAALTRLQEAGRIRVNAEGAYLASEFFVAAGDSVGWEAAVFDHYHALVKTICCKLNPDPDLQLPAHAIGGSTYTFDVWKQHPMFDEVIDTLARMRNASTELRARVEAYNASHGKPDDFLQVIAYAGQCVLSREHDEGNGTP